MLERDKFELILDTYLAYLGGDGDIYLLQDLHRMDGGGMTNDMFHRLGREYGGDEEVWNKYQGIRDELEGRMVKRAAVDKEFRALIAPMLGNFWMRERDEVRKGVSGEVVSRFSEERDRGIFEEFVGKCRGMGGV